MDLSLPLLLSIIIMSASGCATWRPYDRSELKSGLPLPNTLRATRQDSSRVAIVFPTVKSDTLYGRRNDRPIAVPLSDIVSLERERLNAGRTIAAVIGIPAVALGFTFLVLCMDSDCAPTY